MKGNSEIAYLDQPGWVGWVFMCSIGNQLFSVGLVDQLFQPTQNLAEIVENDGYRPLSQSWALIRCVTQQTPSCLTRLESGAHYPQEYVRVFNSFNRKRLRLKRFFPTEHDLKFLRGKENSHIVMPDRTAQNLF